MAKADTFKCSVVTPERIVLERDARFVAFPAHDGEIGVLINRAPLLCKLGIGPMRIEAADGSTETLFIDGGFGQIADNHVTMLTQQAKKVSEIDLAAAQRALADALAMKITDDESFDARQNAIKRAQVQIELAEK